MFQFCSENMKANMTINSLFLKLREEGEEVASKPKGRSGLMSQPR